MLRTKTNEQIQTFKQVSLNIKLSLYFTDYILQRKPFLRFFLGFLINKNEDEPVDQCYCIAMFDF